MHSSNSYRSRVTTRMQCSCGITRYYVIATDHVCAKSAELVHIEVKRLTEFTVFSDESVELNDLSLDLLTSLLEKKPSLSPLFAESSSQ